MDDVEIQRRRGDTKEHGRRHSDHDEVDASLDQEPHQRGGIRDEGSTRLKLIKVSS